VKGKFRVSNRLLHRASIVSLRAFRDEVAKVAGHFVFAAAGNEKAEEWLKKNGHPLKRAAGETTNVGGGFLVPTPMLNVLIDLREERGVFRRNARIVPMSADSISQPRRTGGLTATFTPEAGSTSEGSLTWDNVFFAGKKLSTLTRASSELIEDAAVDVGSQVTSEIAYAFASKEDDCGFNGDGTSTYGGIRGITQLLIDGNHNAGKVAAASAHNSFSTLDITDLTTCLGKLPSYALDGAKWFISVMGFATCFCRLAGAGGGIQTVDVGGQRMLSFLGLPIQICNVLPTTIGTQTGSVMLAVGDLSLAATLAERRAVTVAVAQEKYLDQDQIGIRGSERVDIVCHDLGDNTNAGPVVGLVGTA
jgi:HK97 family phage major capsid protein